MRIWKIMVSIAILPILMMASNMHGRIAFCERMAFEHEISYEFELDRIAENERLEKEAMRNADRPSLSLSEKQDYHALARIFRSQGMRAKAAAAEELTLKRQYELAAWRPWLALPQERWLPIRAPVASWVK